MWQKLVNGIIGNIEENDIEALLAIKHHLVIVNGIWCFSTWRKIFNPLTLDCRKGTDEKKGKVIFLPHTFYTVNFIKFFKQTEFKY